jgi:hypothetical protein
MPVNPTRYTSINTTVARQALRLAAAAACLLLSGCAADRMEHRVPYVILTNVGVGDGYHRAVERLAAHRQARVLSFDPQRPMASKDELQRLRPRYVALVLKPRDLDINVARGVLMLSTELDDDPFCDFAYGFITGATAADALAFVDNIIKAEREGVAGKPLSVGGILNISTTSAMQSATVSFLAPLAQSDAAISLSRGDPSAASFFAQNAKTLAGRRALVIAYQGDPHMLWLFKNGTQPWGKYDPKQVEAPPVKLQGVDSETIGKIDLYPAVVYGAMSHGGAVSRVLVDSGLAPTFGDTGGVLRFYEMSADFSFALSVLRAGAIGYFAALGRTNGFFNDEALYHTFLHGEPLGEIHKRGLDMLVMGFLGNRPRLKLYGEGDPDSLDGTMASGSYSPGKTGQTGYMISFLANRVYLGDPALSPFGDSRTHKLRLVTTKTSTLDGGALRVAVSFNKPAKVLYPVDDHMHHGGTRIYTTVELPAALSEAAALKVEVAEKDPKLDITRLIHAVERRDGAALLHLELDIPAKNTLLDAVNFQAALRITRR